VSGQLTGLLTERVFRALDARLERDVDRPIALALSGGGDSMALLDLARAWAGARGRRLLALTVDHGLNPDSPDWSRRAQAAARAMGADWRGLSWDRAKPTTGLPAAARQARHRLLAEAARAAGARVILTGHTADDGIEGDWMRAEGSTLGALRAWSPSPAWPKGRGLMLLRPLLGETRQALRDHLTARGLDWIEDPANADPRFARGRARAALATTRDRPPPVPASKAVPSPSSVQATAEGLVVVRNASARVLAAAAVCVGGGDRPPRGDRLRRLVDLAADGRPFIATLGGAAVHGSGDAVVLVRNAGEYARRPTPPLALTPGVATVWDGRFEITTQTDGFRVAPAAGRMAALPRADRAGLKTLHPGVRGGLPVLIRDDGSDPVLAWRRAEVRCLVGPRLAQSLDQTPHESDLDPAPNGATPGNALSSFPNIH
jgi:tRNA(Ile)-lysidine synthase